MCVCVCVCECISICLPCKCLLLLPLVCFKLIFFSLQMWMGRRNDDDYLFARLSPSFSSTMVRLQAIRTVLKHIDATDHNLQEPLLNGWVCVLQLLFLLNAMRCICNGAKCLKVLPTMHNCATCTEPLATKQDQKKSTLIANNCTHTHTHQHFQWSVEENEQRKCHLIVAVSLWTGQFPFCRIWTCLKCAYRAEEMQLIAVKFFGGGTMDVRWLIVVILFVGRWWNGANLICVRCCDGGGGGDGGSGHCNAGRRGCCGGCFIWRNLIEIG